MYYLKADIQQPVAFLSAGNFVADNPWIHAARTIDSYEIIIGVQGKVYIQQDNDQYVLNEGDVLLLLPGHPHKGYALSGKGTSFYWIHFFCSGNCEILDNKNAEEEIYLVRNNPYFVGLDSKVIIPGLFNASYIERVKILVRQLLHIYEAHYYSRQATDYILTSLLIELSEQAISSMEDRKKAPNRESQLPKILEWIRIHASKELSLQQVAHEFNYSKEYLARYFRKNMGMSMQEYIHKLKISKAKGLLCESDKTIKEIATQLGFEDEKYFMKLFKRYEKLTPKSYRKAYNMTHLNNQ